VHLTLVDDGPRRGALETAISDRGLCARRIRPQPLA